MLHCALAAVTADPPMTVARQRLREALAAKNRAEDALQTANAAVERVRQVIRDAESTDAKAAAAEAAARSASRSWAVAGAPSDDSPANRELLDRAETALRRAADAHTVAEGARQGLAQLEQQAQEAGIAVSCASEEIRSAATAMLLATVERKIAALERAAAEYAEASVSIEALREILRGWGPAHPWSAYSSPTAAEQIARRVLKAMRKPGDEELREHSRGWASFAKRLREDPDAQLN
jgi:hypothetical protein